MMEPDGDKIRAVVWSEVFPWLRIIRAFRLAIAFRALVLGAVAILLTVAGWGLLGTVFSTDCRATKWLESYSECPWQAITETVPDRPWLIGSGMEMPVSSWQQDNPMFYSWETLTQPAIKGISQTGLSATPLRAIASIILCGLWTAAIWAFFGAAICRTAAVQLAVEEQVGWGAAMLYDLTRRRFYYDAAEAIAQFQIEQLDPGGSWPTRKASNKANVLQHTVSAAICLLESVREAQ